LVVVTVFVELWVIPTVTAVPAVTLDPFVKLLASVVAESLVVVAVAVDPLV
jgi:hypothetical protein